MIVLIEKLMKKLKIQPKLQDVPKQEIKARIRKHLVVDK
jgi:translation elongation factor EF-1beta